MDQPIVLDKVLIVDDNPTILVSPEKLADEVFNEAFQPPVDKDFELQERWINAIAHCPFLMPEQLWKIGKIQVCINFLPAEPQI